MIPRFSSYGWDTLVYYSHSAQDRRSVAGGLRNPMCRYRQSVATVASVTSIMCSLFPTEVSCTVPNVGAGGTDQLHNGLCVLTQVIITQHYVQKY